jgi:beta-glucosidase
MIKKGESRRIEFKLKASDLAYWDTSAGQWTVESGSVNIQAGASSADIRLIKKINIE